MSEREQQRPTPDVGLSASEAKEEQLRVCDTCGSVILASAEQKHQGWHDRSRNLLGRGSVGDERGVGGDA